MPSELTNEVKEEQQLDAAGGEFYTGQTSGVGATVSLSRSSLARVRMTLSADQSISNSGTIKVAFDQTDYDPEENFDATNNRYVAKKEGFYYVTFTATGDAMSDQIDFLSHIYKNGVSIARFIANTSKAGGNATVSTTIVDAVDLMVGDYIEFYVDHNDSVSRNILSNSAYTFAVIHLLSA